MAKIQKDTTAHVIRAVQQHYFQEDPAPKFVNVDAKTVRVDRFDSRFFCAKVTLEVDTATGSKSHTVHIKFQLGLKGELVASSLSYL